MFAGLHRLDLFIYLFRELPPQDGPSISDTSYVQHEVVSS